MDKQNLLDQQIQTLINEAPKDGTTPALVEAIAPVLTFMANQLRHTQYYIVQTLDQDWAVTTFSGETETDPERTVIYAFSALKDAAASMHLRDPQMMALPLPVTHILFQLLALETIHSVIFFEVPGNATVGTEIKREDLAGFVQAHLQDLANPQPIPPDIA